MFGKGIYLKKLEQRGGVSKKTTFGMGRLRINLNSKKYLHCSRHVFSIRDIIVVTVDTMHRPVDFFNCMLGLRTNFIMEDGGLEILVYNLRPPQ